MSSHRWECKIEYFESSKTGDEFVFFNEIYELNDIIESGPNFYSIKKITIKLARKNAEKFWENIKDD